MCENSGSIVYFEGGSVEKCKDGPCKGENCIFYKESNGFIATSCPVRPQLNLSSLLVSDLTDASRIVSNGTYGTSSIIVVQDMSECKRTQGVGEDALSEARRALEQNTKTGHSSGRLLSLIGSDAIKRNTGGFEKNFVSLIEGIVQVGTNYSGTWTFGVRAVGGADLFLKKNLLLSTQSKSARQVLCNGTIWAQSQVTIAPNEPYPVSIFYRGGPSEAALPRVELFGFLSTYDQHLKILSCGEPRDVGVPSLPPGTVFTFDISLCAAGYDNPQCRQPICDAFSCLNGGTCVAPNQCECVGGRYGDNCRACSGSHWEIFGMCIHIWIAGTSLAGLTMVVLLAAFARQAKGAYRARKQFKFLELEVKDTVADIFEGKSDRVTTKQLQMLQNRTRNGGGMWKAIKSQKEAELKLLKENFIPKARLNFGSVFASGAAGQVYSAKYDSVAVCVKELFSSLIDPSDLKDFVHESSLLAQMSHPHIVRFYGITVDKESLFIVTEKCEDNLEHYLKTAVLSPQSQLKLLLQIARGMEYVHSLGIVHRDLKLSNILVTEEPTGIHTKICDFGVSTCIGIGEDTHMKDVVGTPGGIAPEVLLRNTKPSLLKKLDVFSFGMLAWQICAGTAACSKLLKIFGDGHELNKAIAERNFRPKIVPSWHYVIRDVISKCWERDPKSRPPFSDVVETLADSVYR